MAKRAQKAALKTPKVRKPRTKANAPGVSAAGGLLPGKDHNGPSRLTPDEEQALFNSHRRRWNDYQNKLAVAEEFGTKIKGDLKSDGFTVKQMQIADSLKTPKGEKRVVGEVEERLKVARWVGHKMGNQLDMFAQPDREPATDRAFREGTIASQEGAAIKPPYDQSLPQYQSWLQGFHKDQERLLGTVGTGRAAAAPRPPAAKDPVTSKDGDAVTGGTPTPRSEFKQSLKDTAAEGEKIIQGDQAPAPSEAAPEGTSKH